MTNLGAIPRGVYSAGTSTSAVLDGNQLPAETGEVEDFSRVVWPFLQVLALTGADTPFRC